MPKTVGATRLSRRLTPRTMMDGKGLLLQGHRYLGVEAEHARQRGGRGLARPRPSSIAP